MISKVVVNDDNTIDTSERGIYFSQNEAEEAILDWSTNNRMHLLCYIMRIVPRRKQFSDDFVKVAEGEPLSDDMICRSSFISQQASNESSTSTLVMRCGISVLTGEHLLYSIVVSPNCQLLNVTS